MRNRNLRENINLLLVLISVAVAIYSIYKQYAGNNPHIKIQILSAEKLSKVLDEAKLSTEILYRGEKVTNLWRIILDIENTSNVTIRGDSSSSLMSDSLPIKVDEKYRILDIRTITSDPQLNHYIDESGDAKIFFDQWMPDEKAKLSIFISSENENDIPIISTNERGLIGGKIEVEYQKNSNGEIVPPTWKFKISKSSYETISFIVGYTYISILVLFVFIIYTAPVEFIKLQRWKRRHDKNFKAYIDKIDLQEHSQNIFIECKEKWKKEPEHTPEYVWNDFPGERTSFTPIFTTWKSLLIFVSGLIIVVISGALLILTTPV